MCTDFRITYANKTQDDHGSSGSHPHSDCPNWRPAETIDGYLENCREGLEDYSERRAAKLMGISRAELWRWKLLAEIPEDLLERLFEVKPVPSTKSLALIAQAFKGGNDNPDVECCPHCGGILRFRRRVSPRVAKIVADWLVERSERAP
jgi:hypothetical protein